MKQVLVMIALILVACNSQHTQSGEGSALSFNAGEKWKVNAEMTPFIEKGNEILAQYISSQDSDFQNLAAALKAENKKLIKSCTMKGASHDELHKWLHPHMELIEDLQDVENADEANAVIKQLKASFDKYKMYFE